MLSSGYVPSWLAMRVCNPLSADWKGGKKHSSLNSISCNSAISHCIVHSSECVNCFRFLIISQLVLTGYSVQVVALATIIGIDAGLCCMERHSPTTRIPRLWSRWTPLIWVPLGACVQWSNATAIGLQALIAACALGWQWMEEHSTYWQTMKKIAGAFDMGG